MLKRIMRVAIVLILFVGIPSSAETDTVCILHTNDIHDHVRSGYGGLGGLPYVSGYVKSVRAERKDTLLVDAGDVFHKGDMVAARSDSKINYEAMGKIGYDAAAPGNHDIDLGFPYLQEQCDDVGISMLCVNIKGEGGKPFFAPSKIIDVDGVKVGVIGLTATGRSDILNAKETAQAVAKEAERLEPLEIGRASCRERV